MEELAYTDRTCIIVMDIGSNSETVEIGIIVDEVSEVLNVQAAEIEDPPSFGVSLDTSMILGMAKLEGGVKILLNTEQLFKEEEAEVIDNMT